MVCVRRIIHHRLLYFPEAKRWDLEPQKQKFTINTEAVLTFIIVSKCPAGLEEWAAKPRQTQPMGWNFRTGLVIETVPLANDFNLKFSASGSIPSEKMGYKCERRRIIMKKVMPLVVDNIYYSSKDFIWTCFL